MIITGIDIQCILLRYSSIAFLVRHFYCTALVSGANPNAETPTHETPLGLACKAGHTEIAVNLINRGAILVCTA